MGKMDDARTLAVEMTEDALHERGALEEQTITLHSALAVANDSQERKRLLRNLDDVVGERLALEGDHAEEFRIVDAETVQADAEF